MTQFASSVDHDTAETVLAGDIQAAQTAYMAFCARENISLPDTLLRLISLAVLPVTARALSISNPQVKQVALDLVEANCRKALDTFFHAARKTP